MENVTCPGCGGQKATKISANEYRCEYCGHVFSVAPQRFEQPASQPQQKYQPAPEVNKSGDDKPGCFMNGLCFLIPLLGLILYFVKKKEQPQCAKSYLTWAIVGFVINLVLEFSGFWEGFWYGFYSAL